MQKRIPLSPDSSNCSDCNLGHVCIPVGMASADVQRLDELVQDRVRLAKGSTLYTVNDSLDAVYSVRYGSLKTHITDSADHHQITGFILPGEIIGLDGMLQRRHATTATAMEDTEVCVIRLSQIDRVAGELPSFQHQMRGLMSRELERSYQLLASISNMRAEQRLAGFLLNLSQRYAALGYSSTAFVLRMSREEIGNYLGLTLETTSRVLSRLSQDGLISIRLREVQILDLLGLKKLLKQNPC
jgi:CRP/FNR family transcriptional regulator